MPKASAHGDPFEMQSEERVCVLPSDGLLSYSDTWQTLIGQGHPSGHLVCGPRGAYVRVCLRVCACVRACLYVITIELSFCNHTISVFVHMCLCEYEEVLL